MSGIDAGLDGRFERDTPLVDAVVPSPNHGERAGAIRPDCLILHYTGMADAETAIAWLREPRSQVSCHYVVEEGGALLQLVPESRRAWHAGRSSWHGETDLNSRSVGVEIVNAGHSGGLPPYPDPQIATVVALCRDLVRRHRIAPERVLGHSDIAPNRKQDPGERFPWDRLFRSGVGRWVPPRPDTAGPCLAAGACGPQVADLQRALRTYGYDVTPTGRFDSATAYAVRSFQLHFRPVRVDGIADPATVGTLQDLLVAAGLSPSR